MACEMAKLQNNMVSVENNLQELSEEEEMTKENFDPINREDNPQYYEATRTKLEPIFKEIRLERLRQDGAWGGPDHDDTHNSHDWLAYILKHAGRAVMWPWDRSVFRRQMIIVAALAVAAIQWCDRMEEPK